MSENNGNGQSSLEDNQEFTAEELQYYKLIDNALKDYDLAALRKHYEGLSGLGGNSQTERKTTLEQVLQADGSIHPNVALFKKGLQVLMKNGVSLADLATTASSQSLAPSQPAQGAGMVWPMVSAEMVQKVEDGLGKKHSSEVGNRLQTLLAALPSTQSANLLSYFQQTKPSVSPDVVTAGGPENVQRLSRLREIFQGLAKQNALPDELLAPASPGPAPGPGADTNQAPSGAAAPSDSPAKADPPSSGQGVAESQRVPEWVCPDWMKEKSENFVFGNSQAQGHEAAAFYARRLGVPIDKLIGAHVFKTWQIAEVAEGKHIILHNPFDRRQPRIRDTWATISSKRPSLQTFAAMAELAKLRGWTKISIKSHTGMAWDDMALAAVRQGLEVDLSVYPQREMAKYSKRLERVQNQFAAEQIRLHREQLAPAPIKRPRFDNMSMVERRFTHRRLAAVSREFDDLAHKVNTRPASVTSLTSFAASTELYLESARGVDVTFLQKLRHQIPIIVECIENGKLGVPAGLRGIEAGRLMNSVALIEHRLELESIAVAGAASLKAELARRNEGMMLPTPSPLSSPAGRGPKAKAGAPGMG